jgi:hypothetical protein
MIAIITGPLIVSLVQASMMIGQAFLTTMTMIGQAVLTTIGAVLTGMIGLQVGLMIGEVVRGIAGAVPVGIAKLGL